jgi:hypothetical protein
LPEAGVHFRAEMLYAELEVLQQLRPKAKAALLTEARRDPAWAVLRSIPYFGPVRVALLLATLQTPWRFRTKRHLWAFAGFAVVTRTSSEYELVQGRPVRRRRRLVRTRGFEPDSQSGRESRVQSGGERRERTARPVTGLVCGLARARDARGTRAGDARAEAGRGVVTCVEARRAVRCDATDGASGLIPHARLS